MSNQIRHLRSSVAGKRPTGKTAANAGELYINFADKVLGYIDAAGTPVDLPHGHLSVKLRDGSSRNITVV